MQSDTGRQILLAVFPLVFQIKVTRTILIIADFLLSEQIVFDPPGARAKTVQTICTLDTIKQNRNQTLHRHRLP